MLYHKKRTMVALLFLLQTTSVFALKNMSDESLGDVVAQDGITVQIFSDHISIEKIILHDNDGLQPINGYGLASPEAGAIIINQLHLMIQNQIAPFLKLALDADRGVAADGSESMLNIKATVGAMDITVGSIGIGSSNVENVGPLVSARRGASNEIKIMDGFTVNLGELTFNTQLGHQSQGALMKIYGKIENGVRISNVGILADSSSTYAFGMKDVLVRDGGGMSNDLTFNGLAVSVDDTAGIIITPSAGKTLDISMSEFSYGGSASGPSNSIGGVSISGLVLGGNTISIVGH